LRISVLVCEKDYIFVNGVSLPQSDTSNEQKLGKDVETNE